MRRSRIRLGPDESGNWRMPVEPALLKMVRKSWGKWVPKQIEGSGKVIFLPSRTRG